MVSDISPGRFGNSNLSPELVSVNGTLFFAAVADDTHGSELWKSDGTAAGTALVKDILPGAASSYPFRLANVNGTLLFWANFEAHGPELWMSDGTAAGTLLVKAFPQAVLGISPPFNANGALFFFADDGGHGFQIC